MLTYKQVYNRYFFECVLQKIGSSTRAVYVISHGGKKEEYTCNIVIFLLKCFQRVKRDFQKGMKWNEMIVNVLSNINWFDSHLCGEIYCIRIQLKANV